MIRKRKQAGFSLIELLVVVAVIFIMLGAAILSIQPMLGRSKAQTAGWSGPRACGSLGPRR